MIIKKLGMRLVEMPLKQPFHTHLETVFIRQAIIIELQDQQGTVGWGEASAFSTPWYTEETVRTEWHILKDVLFPMLKNREIQSPKEISDLFQCIRGNRMAKAGVESAVWDLYAKRLNKPLYQVLGGRRQEIAVGAVAAGKTIEDTLGKIEFLNWCGYERIKIKLHPQTDLTMLQAIRRQFPETRIMADANSAYSPQDIKKLKQLDEFKLMMIEQPFHVEDLWEHAKLQKKMNTPVCLDESIRSLQDAKSAIEMGACRVINVKYSRLGGLAEAKKVHDYSRKMNVDLWAGGMIEFGVSRAHNIALASLPGFTLPGDIVSTDFYWEKDIIEPGIFVEKGKIQLSNKAGIGYEVNRRTLEKITKEFYFI